MKHVAYMYLDNDGEEVFLHPCIGDERYCLLSYEIYNDNYPYWWEEDLLKYPSGYYEFKYESFIESEYVDGHISNSYRVVGNLTSLEPSLKAKWLYFKTNRFDPVVLFIGDLFSRNWAVEIMYRGCFGYTKSRMNLLQALWYRFIGHRSEEHIAKDKYEVSLVRR